MTAAYYGASATCRLIGRTFYPVRYQDIVVSYAAEFDVPEEIVYAVILIESKFDAAAVSRAGARGLMQLMPATFRAAAEQTGRIPEEVSVFDPGTNIGCGVYWLSRLFEKYRRWDTALAAYNAGETAVDRWLADPMFAEEDRLTAIPYRETAQYVRRVLRAAALYRKLYREG